MTTAKSTALALLFNGAQNRQLFALALPMILSNITVPLLGLVDTAVIGHLSDAYYLGGVALGSTIITLIIWLLGFLRMATTGLVAQAYGANDTASQLKLLVQGAMLATGLGIAVILLQLPILNLALGLSEASMEVERYCREYFQVRVWSTPFALLNLVMLGWLLGRQQPKAAMWQLILANLANIILDVLFVMGFGWGVKGAALASVCADITAFSVALYMVLQQLKLSSQFKFDQLRVHLTFVGYGKLLKLNSDIFIRSLCLQAAFAFMTFHGAGLGDNTVAANAVLLNLLLLISYALDGIAYYAEAEVGKAYGQKRAQQLHEAVVLAWCWSAITAVGFTLIFSLWGSHIIELLTSIDKVRTTAQTYLIWLVLLPLWSFSSYLFDGVYIGAAQGKVMRNSMIIATFGAFFPTWYLLQSLLPSEQANHALWAAMTAFMLMRSLTLAAHYRFSKTFIVS
ncbi:MULTISPECIES: MATE family efflux transporter [Shewanella]|jgi:MATE family multidrug resistance protein|uniref:MATE family efflux transporter n=1 Tax=Shewanella TaxID=22 RepID=UPI000C12B932|nr:MULTISPECIES: MATE family efflux transporter [Shewanella]MCD8550444.1 MATE family efflux transporter [Shewanella xiamenensis]MCD8558817.1 MATE family efflux transporter [Shewanella xiamenensis]PHY61730.1 MATE family efflux transporter [Shewanella xiamenensis]QQK61933.1 MATE family efflux transporter [Shewanella sp. LC6]TPE47639.1 MATE family efflux transporter [Shewanella sp. LC2]